MNGKYLLVSSAIALLEGIRAPGPSALRVAAYLVGTLLRNPLVISSLLGILFSMAALPLPKVASNYLDLMGCRRSPCGPIRVGAFSRWSQIDRQCWRSDMAFSAENSR